MKRKARSQHKETDRDGDREDKAVLDKRNPGDRQYRAEEEFTANTHCTEAAASGTVLVHSIILSII